MPGLATELRTSPEVRIGQQRKWSFEKHKRGARHSLRIVNLRFWCTVIDVETERRSLDHIARAPLDPRYPDATKVERRGDQSEQVR
jgi:hypothetical protein